MLKNKFDNKIETSRLLLRRLSMDDLIDMFEYTSNLIVTTHLSWHPHTDHNQTKQFIEKVIEKYDKAQTEFVYGIELKTEKKLIGVLRVFNVSFADKRGEFSSILNPYYQKKGFMGEAWQGLLTYCFDNVGLNRIQSYVTVDNIASQKKNERAGLIFEGRLKDYFIMKGKFKDALVYAITAKTFSKNKK